MGREVVSRVVGREVEARRSREEVKVRCLRNSEVANEAMMKNDASNSTPYSCKTLGPTGEAGLGVDLCG